MSALYELLVRCEPSIASLDVGEVGLPEFGVVERRGWVLVNIDRAAADPAVACGVGTPDHGQVSWADAEPRMLWSQDVGESPPRREVLDLWFGGRPRHDEE
jgi:hypothetical protein